MIVEENAECVSSKICNFVNKNLDTGFVAQLGRSGTNLVLLRNVVGKMVLSTGYKSASLKLKLNLKKTKKVDRKKA